MKLTVLKSWVPFFEAEMQKPYWKKLMEKLRETATQAEIYPEKNEIFRLFKLVGPQEVKVILIGQDPYHGPQQANGLAFSVHDHLPTPPSLQNIFKELAADLQIAHPHNDLAGWAKQGVFLINTVLTVTARKPGSHQGYGWEIFVNNCLTYLNQLNPRLIYCLFGKWAEKIYNNLNVIDESLVVKVGHPSPFSYERGFKNTKPFSQINHLLKQEQLIPIDWSQ